jgi:hypothetical protein
MENRSISEDDGDVKKAPAGARTLDLTEVSINVDDFAQEISSDLSVMTVWSVPSDSPLVASSQSPSPFSMLFSSEYPLVVTARNQDVRAFPDHDDHSVAHGSVSGTKKLDHEPLPPAWSRTEDSSEWPPVFLASAAGTFPVGSSRNTESDIQVSNYSP